MEQPGLFTVGHSNHSLEEFLKLLRLHNIQVIVDTRSYPYSKYVPHFNREDFQKVLTCAAIQYLDMGQELGGRPTEEEFYDAEGHVLYHRIAESPTFLKGIERLENGIRRFRVAILCSEENPEVCHRHLLVGRVLSDRGSLVQHIRGDGSIQQTSELRAADQGQRSLFEAFEENKWKSLQSVSRRKPPPSSSNFLSAVESDDWSMSD